MKNKINKYTCNNGHALVTRDRDEGVTPMFVPCSKCKGKTIDKMARSHFYNVEGNPTPTHEWYSPGLVHRLLMKLNRHPAYPHVKMGGLLLRKIRKMELIGYFWQPAGKWHILPYLQFSAEEADGFGCVSLELGFLTRWAALELYFRKGGQS